jgi:hypothetical protein
MLRLSQLWSFLSLALAAVLLFQEAAHREAATAELAREVAASLTRAQGSSSGVFS